MFYWSSTKWIGDRTRDHFMYGSPDSLEGALLSVNQTHAFVSFIPDCCLGDHHVNKTPMNCLVNYENESMGMNARKNCKCFFKSHRALEICTHLHFTISGIFPHLYEMYSFPQRLMQYWMFSISWGIKVFTSSSNSSVWLLKGIELSPKGKTNPFIMADITWLKMAMNTSQILVISVSADVIKSLTASLQRATTLQRAITRLSLKHFNVDGTD